MSLTKMIYRGGMTNTSPTPLNIIPQPGVGSDTTVGISTRQPKKIQSPQLPRDITADLCYKSSERESSDIFILITSPAVSSFEINISALVVSSFPCKTMTANGEALSCILTKGNASVTAV